MTDKQQALSLFEEDDKTRPASNPEVVEEMMSEVTRGQVRSAFATLGIRTAREQFAVVAELTGQPITSVTDMTQRQAHTLLVRLSRRIEASTRRNTGNAWADRTEDTWIDKM